MTCFRTMLTLVLALSAAPVQAWWDAGHKIVAAIAYRQLSPAERQATFKLLQTHPRWQPDFVDWLPEHLVHGDPAEQAEWTFMQAAVWADIVRDFEGEELETYHRATWHYINVPIYLTPADERALSLKVKVNASLDPPAEPIELMNSVQTTLVAQKLLADPATPAATRALMLTWIFHLLGDSHQPMHTSTIFSQKLFPDGCRGGNSIKTRQRENLHAVWDGLLGERLGYRQARNEALRLLSDPAHRAAGEHAARSLDAREWLSESREIAEQVAFGPEVLGPLRAAEQSGAKAPTITLSEDYLSHAGQIAKRRAVEAGYRLATILKEAVK